MATVFLVGLIAGAGLMAALIFGIEAWFNYRHPLSKLGRDAVRS